MGTWMPLLIAIVSVVAMLYGNLRVQEKMLATHNKEKAVDLLIKTINELHNLYVKYWENNKHDASFARQIRAKQTRFSDLFYFSNEKYLLENKTEFELCIEELFIFATRGNFDSSARNQPEPDKCIGISKLVNKAVIMALHNKV